MLGPFALPTRRSCQTLIFHSNSNVILATTSKKWRYRLPPNFFGLSDKYIEIVYEELFSLKYHGGLSLFESYNLPVQVRRWFLRRLQKQFDDEHKQTEKQTK
tara:strand:- start:1184 stop:1489 length:306 start_codon:yes stop_codon:yes gene_type:complete